MRAIDHLMQSALGLNSPWIVTASVFDVEKQCLVITIDFTKGSLFACSGCDKPDCSIHDTKRKVWRHLDFFQHKTYLHSRVPRDLHASTAASDRSCLPGRVPGRASRCCWTPPS